MKIKTTQIEQAAVKIANCKDIKKKDISKSLIKTANKNTNEKHMRFEIVSKENNASVKDFLDNSYLKVFFYGTPLKYYLDLEEKKRRRIAEYKRKTEKRENSKEAKAKQK